MTNLSIAYFTSRKNPLIEMFFDSLDRELAGDYTDKRIIVVDFWAEEEGRKEYIASRANDEQRKVLVHVPPKPTPWQGKYRITKEDWWAVCNARNTAICLASDGWMVLCDDLSVMIPGYGAALRRAMQRDRTITCGAYRKVNKLVVENGDLVSFEDHPAGHDNRLAHAPNGAIGCAGNWMYGCSLIAPVESFLEIGGYPEAWCDSLSFEDVIGGILAERRGWKFVYDPAMMTFESEEAHHGGPAMKRSDYGQSPNDKSHHVLRMAQSSNGFHPNYFGEEGIRGLRQRVLSGDPFPIVGIPENEWFTGTLLSELK